MNDKSGKKINKFIQIFYFNKYLKLTSKKFQIDVHTEEKTEKEGLNKQSLLFGVIASVLLICSFFCSQ